MDVESDGGLPDFEGESPDLERGWLDPERVRPRMADPVAAAVRVAAAAANGLGGLFPIFLFFRFN